MDDQNKYQVKFSHRNKTFIVGKGNPNYGKNTQVHIVMHCEDDVFRSGSSRYKNINTGTRRSVSVNKSLYLEDMIINLLKSNDCLNAALAYEILKTKIGRS